MNYIAEEVFISYSSKDSEIALKIKNILESPPRSVSCWMANDITISGGDDFRSRIVSAIRSCKVFLFILSDSSMQSHWCSSELSFAIMADKKIYSIRVDDSPITEICSFKLGCSQITDGVVNLDAVIESLAINVKNGRDEVLEEEKMEMTNNKTFRVDLYFILSVFHKISLLVAIICFVILIGHSIRAGGVIELLSLPSTDSSVIEALSALKIFIIALLAHFVIDTILFILFSRIKEYAEMDSPSALYTMYCIFTYCHLITFIFGRKKAFEYLQRSGNLGYSLAVKRLEIIFKRKNTLLKKNEG